MSYLRGSANYVWCTTSVLGKGATGAVFQGVSKHDGEPVAVKTFNQLSHMRPQEVQLREFEVLKKVKHENIVKLLAIEEEQDGRGKVIVMELCTGGSLYNLLDDPENTYGLSEDDFLLVLSHLSAGMKHLRDNNIVHRDLKPGNIMKFIAEDGQIMFKLTDFGAARELEEDQEFVSLYGTEEYLHPDMYERAVLRKPMPMVGKKTFSASVDLWSIGVTLYHVATGFLPFRPYGGRKNKEMMHFITTKKESGVISGCQLTENGQIEWKKELPSSCQISNGLKNLITPLLAGLMEVDERKRWTYETFFQAVSKIMQKTRVHLFYLNKIQTLRIYMDPEISKSPVSTIPYSFSLQSTSSHDSFQNFQKLILEQTDISPENQIILHKEGNISMTYNSSTGGPTSGSGTGSKSYTSLISQFQLPPTTEENPLILCDKENINVIFDWDMKDLPKFSIFPNLVNVENDATLAKLSCAVGYSYKRKIEKICLSVHLITVAVETIVSVISGELTSVSKDSCAKIQSRVHSVGQLFTVMEQIQKACQGFVGVGQTTKDKDSKSENSSITSASASASASVSASASASETQSQPQSASAVEAEASAEVSQEDSASANVKVNSNANATSMTMTFRDLDNLLQSRLNSMSKMTGSQASQFRQLTERLEALEQPINILYSRFVQNGSLMSEWKDRTLDLSLKHAGSSSVASSISSQGQNQGQSQSQGQSYSPGHAHHSHAHHHGHGQGSNPASVQVQGLNSHSTTIFNNSPLSTAAGSISRAGKKAATHVGKLRESWQHLLRDRATRSLTYNDEQFHILERIKMQAKSKCLSELLNEECQLVIVGLTEVLSDWYKQAQAALIQTDILAKDMNVLERNVQDFLLGMDEILEGFQTDLEIVMLTLKDRQELVEKQQQQLLHYQQQQKQREKELQEKPNVQHKAVSVKVKSKSSSKNHRTLTSSNLNSSPITNSQVLANNLLTKNPTSLRKSIGIGMQNDHKVTGLTADELQFDSVALDMDLEIDDGVEDEEDEGQGSWHVNSNRLRMQSNMDNSLNNNPNAGSNNNMLKGLGGKGGPGIGGGPGSRSSRSKGSSRMEQHDRTMRKGIKDLSVVQEEVWSMLKENAELLNQFQAMTLSLFAQEEGGSGHDLELGHGHGLGHGPSSGGDSSGASSRK